MPSTINRQTPKTPAQREAGSCGVRGGATHHERWATVPCSCRMNSAQAPSCVPAREWTGPWPGWASAHRRRVAFCQRQPHRNLPNYAEPPSRPLTRDGPGGTLGDPTHRVCPRPARIRARGLISHPSLDARGRSGGPGAQVISQRPRRLLFAFHASLRGVSPFPGPRLRFSSRSPRPGGASSCPEHEGPRLSLSKRRLGAAHRSEEVAA